MSPDEEFNEKRSKRVVTSERARLSANRLINSAFRNTEREHARFSIPVNLDDDDIVILDYISQQSKRERGA